jgi:hypothetical protein
LCDLLHHFTEQAVVSIQDAAVSIVADDHDLLITRSILGVVD